MKKLLRTETHLTLQFLYLHSSMLQESSTVYRYTCDWLSSNHSYDFKFIIISHDWKTCACNRLNDKYIKLYHDKVFIYNSYTKPHIFVHFTGQTKWCGQWHLQLSPWRNKHECRERDVMAENKHKVQNATYCIII